MHLNIRSNVIKGFNFSTYNKMYNHVITESMIGIKFSQKKLLVLKFKRMECMVKVDVTIWKYIIWYVIFTN